MRAPSAPPGPSPVSNAGRTRQAAAAGRTPPAADPEGAGSAGGATLPGAFPAASPQRGALQTADEPGRLGRADRTGSGSALLAVGAAIALLTAPAAAGAESAAPAGDVDLTGTWHVLIHYRDDTAHSKDVMRWEDRVWVFEREGGELRWTKYPLVVFEDSSGRFERLGTNRASRVLGAWEPNEGQLAQIREGLTVNPRGSKSKALERSDTGWTSSGRALAAGANVVTYQETWRIDLEGSLPVFTRDDVLGGATVESFEGRTQYAVEEISPDGDVMRGTYERDGTRHGTFRMMRSGPTNLAGGDEDAMRERQRRQLIDRLLDSGAAGPEMRQELRGEVERSLRAEGLDPEEHPELVDRVTAGVQDDVREALREGRSREAVRELIAERVRRERDRVE